MNIEKKLKELNYVNKFKLRYFHDTIINNFIPVHLNNDYNEKKLLRLINWYDKKIKNFDEDKYKNELIILPKNKIYLILANTWSPDLGHNMAELMILLQIYHSYFKELKIDNYEFNFITKQNYIDREDGKFELYLNKLLYKENQEYLLLNCEKTENNFYKGNFIYIYVNNTLENYYLNLNINKNFYSINNLLISIANEKYKNEKTHDYLWIIREEDIKTYWHKRFLTNIHDENIINLLENKNKFKKIIFPIKENDDFLYQIYLVNNAKIIFSEAGKWFINIYFMKKNTHIISIQAPSIPSYDNTLINVSKTNEINYNIYKETELDISSEFSNHENRRNLPYKISNIDHFTNWLNNILKDIV